MNLTSISKDFRNWSVWISKCLVKLERRQKKLGLGRTRAAGIPSSLRRAREMAAPVGSEAMRGCEGEKMAWESNNLIPILLFSYSKYFWFHLFLFNAHYTLEKNCFKIFFPFQFLSVQKSGKKTKKIKNAK